MGMLASNLVEPLNKSSGQVADESWSNHTAILPSGAHYNQSGKRCIYQYYSHAGLMVQFLDDSLSLVYSLHR